MIPMMPDYVPDFGNYLKTKGFTGIHYVRYPVGENNCIVLFPQDGAPQLTVLGNNMILFKPQLKIHVRNMSAKIAGDAASSIANTLNLMINTRIGSTWVKKCKIVGSGPFPISTNLQNGTTFSINFDLEIN